MEHAPQTLSDMGRRGTVRFPRALKAQVADSQVCSRTHCESNRQKELMTLIQLVILFSTNVVFQKAVLFDVRMYVCIVVTLEQYCFNYVTK